MAEDPNTTFNNSKYKKNEVKGNEFFFADGADDYANRDFKISIKHVPSGQSVEFKAFITAFNDTFSQDWNSQPVYGRADPLYNFKQTTRKISLGFKMPAASESEAYENLAKAQKFSQFLYPNYTDIKGAKTVSQGPLLRIKVMNLLQNTSNVNKNSAGTSYEQVYTSYGTGGEGMLGFCSDVTFNFNLENNDAGVFEKSQGTILPKLIEVSIGSFNPIHEHHLGWDGETFSKGEGELFPYGAKMVTTGEPVGSSFSELEQARLERERAEAAIANAEARYGGMFGDFRQRRDERKMAKGKYSESKSQYVASALAGKTAIDQGFMDDGSLDSDEVWATNTASDLYNGYVGD